MGRVLGRRGRASVVREIEDLLARAERVSDVPAARLAELAEQRGADLARRLRTPRRNLYRRFLEHCLLDQALSARESEDLAHLRALLQLSEAEASQVHDEVGRAVYGQAIEDVLADQRLDPDEEEFLKRIRKELQLPAPVAERLLEEGTERARQRFITRSVTRESLLVAPRNAVLQLDGSSTSTIEDAVRAAVDEAVSAVPKLAWIEIAEVRAELAEGQVARWSVKLKAGVDGER